MAKRLDVRDGLQWRMKGVAWRPAQDLYPRLMGTSWTMTLALAFAAYAGACTVFAGLFALDPGGVKGANSTSDLLWFSVQTLSTIGYGSMTPATSWAHLLVTLESFVGLSGVAVVTAILYAKFSLPDARIQFADKIAVHDTDGVPTLHLRMLNERTTPILDAHVHVGVMLEPAEGDDAGIRRMIDVKLLRDRIPMFGMAFTLMHVLDESSPLYGILHSPERVSFLILTMRGVDDRTLQPVFARALFHHEQIVMGQGFDDVFGQGSDGVFEVDASKLHSVSPRALTLPRPAGR
ncbi:MAG: hypothetical protein KC912_26235 [Proteobacteria bacterium]|nr:hypothetical protein [Pseudomonadota bacterium]